MFRIKLGEHITIGNVSRGPHMVIEVDHVNEISDLINSGAMNTLIGMSQRRAEREGEMWDAIVKKHGLEK